MSTPVVKHNGVVVSAGTVCKLCPHILSRHDTAITGGACRGLLLYRTG